jgi:hypothetical protein
VCAFYIIIDHSSHCHYPPELGDYNGLGPLMQIKISKAEESSKLSEMWENAVCVCVCVCACACVRAGDR